MKIVINPTGVSQVVDGADDNSPQIRVNGVDGDTVFTFEANARFAILNGGETVAQFNTDGTGYICGARVVFGAEDVEIKQRNLVVGEKVKFFQDGSIQLGEATTIDQNGIITQNGAQIVSFNDIVLKNDNGPVVGVVLQSPNGTKFRITVDNDGDLHTEQVSG